MPNSKPPLDYNTGGYAGTGAIRIRTGWFGFAVAEELIEHHTGRREWRRIEFPVQIKGERDA